MGDLYAWELYHELLKTIHMVFFFFLKGKIHKKQPIMYFAGGQTQLCTYVIKCVSTQWLKKWEAAWATPSW